MVQDTAGVVVTAGATREFSRGFTLIELLIVISIVALTASLVAPLGVKQVEKIRAESEWITLRRAVDTLAFRAFAQGRSIEILAAGTRLSWRVDGAIAGELLFERVFFPPGQEIRVTRNGYAEPDRLNASLMGDSRTLKLNEWLYK